MYLLNEGQTVIFLLHIHFGGQTKGQCHLLFCLDIPPLLSCPFALFMLLYNTEGDDNMQQPGKIYDLTEIKFLILFILDFCKNPVAVPVLNDIAMNDEFVDFFSYSTALSELEESGHMVKTAYNEQDYYTISPLGMETNSLFARRVKYHVRKAAQEAAREALKKTRRSERIRADWFELKNDVFVASLSFSENERPLFSLTLHASTKEQAKQICETFEHSAEDIVREITGILSKKAEK